MIRFDLTVTYESGVLKLAAPLAFPDGQILQIRIIAPQTPTPINQAAIDLLRSWREDGDEIVRSPRVRLQKP